MPEELSSWKHTFSQWIWWGHYFLPSGLLTLLYLWQSKLIYLKESKAYTQMQPGPGYVLWPTDWPREVNTIKVEEPEGSLAEADRANSQGVRPPGRPNKSSLLASLFPKDGGFSVKGPPVPPWAQWTTVTCHLRIGIQWGGFPSWGLVPGGSDGKESACNVGDPGSIPGWGRSPGEVNGNPLQYSYLGNPMDRGAWWATVHGVANSQTRLSD